MDKGISRVLYVILALFLGTLGIHNFVAGRTKTGVIQLLMTIVSFGIFALIVWFWNIYEIITVTEDGEGRSFS